LENINKLVKLEKNTNINQYLDDLLTLLKALKQNQLFTPDSSSIFLQNLNSEREIYKNYINNDGKEKISEKLDLEIFKTSDNFNKLKKE
ncbi:14854_t:CDS:2, partial [Cetraspora pellucida]